MSPYSMVDGVTTETLLEIKSEQVDISTRSPEWHSPLEFVSKWNIIQKHIRIPISIVKTIFKGTDTPDDTVYIRIACKYYKSGVCKRSIRLRRVRALLFVCSKARSDAR